MPAETMNELTFAGWLAEFTATRATPQGSGRARADCDRGHRGKAAGATGCACPAARRRFNSTSGRKLASGASRAAPKSRMGTTQGTNDCAGTPVGRPSAAACRTTSLATSPLSSSTPLPTTLGTRTVKSVISS